MTKHFFEEVIEPLFNERWENLSNHPFNLQLKNGSLSKKTYQFYMEQDLLYLRDYAIAFQRIIHLLSANQNHTDTLTNIKDKMIAYEADMRKSYLALVQATTLFRAKTTEKILAVDVYTSHLYSSLCSPAQALAAVLPCFYLYFRLGEFMSPCNADHPYYDWVSSYYSEDFKTDTRALISLFNHYCETVNESEKDTVKTTFFMSINHEIAFMDALLALATIDKLGCAVGI